MPAFAPGRLPGRAPSRLAVILVALALPGFTPACAATALGFAQSLRLAEQRSQALPAEQAAEAAARERAVAAGQRPDPVLQLGVNNLPITGPDRFNLNSDFMTMRSIGVMQELTRSGKLQARAARYEREAEAAQAARQAALAELQRGTAQAWLARYYQERMRELLQRQREQALQQVQAAEAAYRGARGSQADVFAARGALATLDDRLAQAERDVALATTELARWVGAAADAPLGAPPALDEVLAHDADARALVEHHPELLMLDRQVAVAEAEADAARAERQADVSVQLMLSQRGPGYASMGSINISMPLQWDQANRQDRELAARLATAGQLRAERDEMARAHVAQLQGWLQQWRSDRERLARYDEALLPLAAEREQAALAAYRGGTAALGTVLEARRAQIDTLLDRLRLEMDAARLWAQLSFLMPQPRAAEVQR